jgi:small ligand-binding sensory domain FIST
VVNEFSVAAHWPGGFNENGIQQWAESLRRQLRGTPVSLGLVFMTPKLFPYARQVLEILRVHCHIPLLAGCSSQSLIFDGVEVEQNAGLATALYCLPGADLQGVHFTQSQVGEAGGPGYWPLEIGVERNQTNGWLVFIDPFHLDSESWLRTWNEAYAPAPVMGGLAGGELTEQLTQVYLNGEVFEEGGVAISFSGDIRLAGVTSQGCTPIGQTWTLTRVERNIIHQIGNRPAYEVLAETFNTLPAEEQRTARGNLFIGLAVSEYREEFHRGDFLVRNLLAADPRSGAIAVGALPRTGQSMQFQRRSASAATEDLEELLTQARQRLGDTPIYGGCLCSCNGRGVGLFGRPNHDARMVQERFGPTGVAGFFCNGEIGPVGEKSFLHGYTASLALFVKK